MATEEEWRSKTREIEREAKEAEERGYVTVSLGQSRGGYNDEILLAVTPFYIEVLLPSGENFWRHNLEYDGYGHGLPDDEEPSEEE